MIEPKTNLKCKTTVVTPLGRFNFPHLARPDDRFATDRVPAKYKTSLLIEKKDFREDEKGKQLQKVILDFARDFYQAPNITFKDLKDKGIKLPFIDCDLKEKAKDYEAGNIEIKAETIFNNFLIVDANKNPMSKESVEKIKSGHYGRLMVQPYGHIKSPLAPSGIKLYLQVVQYFKAGEEFNNDLSLLDKIEQDLPSGFSLSELEDLDDIKF